MAITYFRGVTPLSTEAERVKNELASDYLRREMERLSPLYRLIHGIRASVPDDIQ